MAAPVLGAVVWTGGFTATSLTGITCSCTASGVTGHKITQSGFQYWDAATGSAPGTTIATGGSGVIPPTFTFGATTITGVSASTLTVGRQGATSPALKVDASTASVVTGLLVKGQASGSGVNLSTIGGSGTESLFIDSQSSGVIVIGGTSTGMISIGRGATKVATFGTTKTSIGTQNSTPTAAQLLGGYIQHTSVTGAGTATLDTGTNISSAITGVVTGDSFECIYTNPGNQTVTFTTATGLTLKGTVALATLKTAILNFYCTGANTWDVVIMISA